jgi:hypothetical protein
MPADPVFEAVHWRIRSDTTAAQGGTPVWATTEDQLAALSWEAGDTFRIRFVMSETSGNNANNEDMRLQYQIGAEGWLDVGAAGTTAEGVIGSTAASSDVDATALTTEILTAGQGTASAGGRYYDNGNTTPDANTDEPDADEFGEHEWGIVLSKTNTNAVVDGETVTFRLLFLGGAMTVNYANVPTITVTITASGISIPVLNYHHKHHNLAG